jgi:CheY-like chemotaxis protein
VCPSCGARLRSKPAGSSAPKARAAEAAPEPEPERGRKSAAAAVMENPSATLPPGTPLRPIPKPGSTSLRDLEDAGASSPARPAEGAVSPAVIEALMEEVREVRRVQEEILALLRERPSRGEAPSSEPNEDPFGFGQDTPMSVPSVAPLRSRRRKTVMVMDDDAATRQAAVSAFERADVPVRAVGDGNSGLQMLAEERCDVLVLELGMGGAMGGKDVVNLIKATMEWVDIPIVLWTRVAVQGQKEARQIHGADELVPKGPGSEEALVARVIQIFRGRP